MTAHGGIAVGSGRVARQVIAVAVVLLLSGMLLWPALLNGGPLTFFDTVGYLDQGRSAMSLVSGKIAAALSPAQGGLGGAAGAAVEDPSFLRSVIYPVLAYIGSLGPLGLMGTVFLQSLIVVVLAAMIAGREVAAHPGPAAAAVAGCIAFTALPWTVSTLMPDVFAAVAILCAVIIAARLDRIGLGGKLFVFAAASLATLSHYGHPPLFLAAAGAALLALAVQRRLSVWAIALAVGPLVFTVVASLGVSQAVFDEASVVPRRMPLLLARSMEDGPARWHLEKHCDVYGYEICTLWDGDFPSDLGSLLWSPDGLLKKATDAQMDVIRAEEMLILKRTLIEYPAAQIWSFVGNAVRQMGMIGLGDTTWGLIVVDEAGEFQRESGAADGPVDLQAIGLAQKAGVLLATALILAFVFSDRLRTGDRERAILFVVVVGLAANATIFGGLSAPVDRYQMRVIWIVPMIAALFWLARRDAVQGRERTHV